MNDLSHSKEITSAMRPMQPKPRAIAVVDVGSTNTKVILYDADLNILAERKTVSPHHRGTLYGEIDIDHIMAFARDALNTLDDIAPIDAIVPSTHGACLVTLTKDGTIALPVMDYVSEPPAEIVEAYERVMPSFEESYTPRLPMALMHALQLFWQRRAMPDAFSKITTMMPLMQYVGYALGGKAVTEISSMSCQSHLIDLRTGNLSSLSHREGWDKLFASRANAWDVTGTFSGKSKGFRGHGAIHAGVHDSNANFLRYLASGRDHFTLLSTGTWIIGFDTDADMTMLNPARDIVGSKSVFGRTIACSRFFGGKEYEIIADGKGTPTLAFVEKLITQATSAAPSFTDSGGPMPNTGAKGRIIGPPPASADERASLASLYCALMVAQSLTALHSQHTVIVDGPFSQNQVFLELLAAFRPTQEILASEARDGTAAGAACLALMPDGKAPHIDVAMRRVSPADIPGLMAYQKAWQALA
jgi:sugar (pentulose or hexulose) kinase